MVEILTLKLVIFDAEKGLLVENKGLLTKKSSYLTAYRIFIRNWNFLVGHSSLLITGVFSKIIGAKKKLHLFQKFHIFNNKWALSYLQNAVQFTFI